MLIKELYVYRCLEIGCVVNIRLCLRQTGASIQYNGNKRAILIHVEVHRSAMCSGNVVCGILKLILRS